MILRGKLKLVIYPKPLLVSLLFHQPWLNLPAAHPFSLRKSSIASLSDLFGTKSLSLQGRPVIGSTWPFRAKWSSSDWRSYVNPSREEYISIPYLPSSSITLAWGKYRIMHDIERNLIQIGIGNLTSLCMQSSVIYTITTMHLHTIRFSLDCSNTFWILASCSSCERTWLEYNTLWYWL